MRADLEKIVWEAKCHPKIRSWKFTLLNLCHHANAGGEAYPSVTKIAQETGYSTRAVIEALEGLEGLGIIRRTGSCGARKRVSVFMLTDLPTNVHNLANGEVSSCLQLFNGELSSKKAPSNSELGSPNSELSSHRSILGNISVGKSVSGAANSELTSPFVDNSAEGGLVKQDKRVQQIAPSARYDGGVQDHKKLMKTLGWKPQTEYDRQHCMYLCYTLGASHEEATRFVRYNAVHRWTVCETATINDAAKQWVEAWRRREPDEYYAERERRRRADKILS